MGGVVLNRPGCAAHLAGMGQHQWWARIREKVREVLVGKQPTGNLSDYDPINCDRTSRVIVDSVEGARCDSKTFTSFDNLSADWDRLMASGGDDRVTPTHCEGGNCSMKGR